MSTKVFQEARKHVQTFANEGDDLMHAHRAAMDCFDCEAIVQIGIDAFDWLLRADQAMRKAAVSGAEVTADDVTQMKDLFRGWFKSSEVVKTWSEGMIQEGFHLENHEKFLQCCAEMAAIVRSFEDDRLPDAMCQLRDEALAEHERGETSEFFPEEE